MASSARSRQNILELSRGEIPEEQLVPPPGSTRLLTAGIGCTCSTDSETQCSCGVRTSLDPIVKVRRFSPRCEV